LHFFAILLLFDHAPVTNGEKLLLMNNVDLGIWGKLTSAIVVLLVGAAILGMVTFYYPLLKQNERMRQVVYNLDTQIQTEKNQERNLTVSIDAMSKDHKAIERLVREKLGYAKPGETVIRFEGSQGGR
jgi:cell division protein FtsB